MSAPVSWDSKLVIGRQARPRPAVAATNSSLNGMSCILLSSSASVMLILFLVDSCTWPYAHYGMTNFC